MPNIVDIDRNFNTATAPVDHLKFYSVLEAPFSLYGVFFENGLFRRMPETVAKGVSERVYDLHTNTAGGRVKFVTDSRFIAVRAKYKDIGRMPHFTLAGSAGFDLYTGKDEIYCSTYVPPYELTDSYTGLKPLAGKALREITINLPLYSSLSSLEIGLEENAVVEKTAGYAYEKPMVFYGSSITQGGCASRPGNAYTNALSRRLNIDHINLGFSGNCKAEEAMGQYIAQLPMSVFIFDYDHNAPDVAYLKKTHERLFRTVREANPELPIVILSRPEYNLNKEERQRRAVIRKTYRDARAAGDKNVYFLDGPQLMKLAGHEGTVDGCHPNDIGFFSMTKALEKLIKPLLK